MTIFLKKFKFNYKEIVYQTLITVVLFVFFSYAQDFSEVSVSSLVATHKFAFFGNYLTAAMVINYLLLPQFYYKKRQVLFFLSVIVLITLVILVDELVLEQIYFPTTRGTYFPGFFYTLVETLPIIIIIVAFKFAWDFHQKQNEIERLKTLVKDSELQFLKSQINPHFLFNNLNNLYSYAIENSPKTPSIILELSSVLRYMLYDCKGDVVPLSKELKHLRNFTALNELQIENRGIVRFTESIKSTEYAISPLILVVFIENAFKHSTESLSKNILIDISLEVSETGLLTFKSINSFKPGYISKSRSKGIGLENVVKRLHLLYAKKHELHIQQNDSLYIVTLTMQLKPLDQC